MREDGLGLQTTHDDALDDVALDPGFGQLLIRHTQLCARLDPRLCEEEVVHADDRDDGSILRVMLKASPASQVAPAAPRPVGHVSSGTVLLHLLLGRLTWTHSHVDLPRFFAELLLDLNPYVVANHLVCGAQ